MTEGVRIIPQEKPEISLNRLINNEWVWIVKMNDEGILFNHEVYCNASDFAKEFMDIMEKNFKIKFLAKET